MKQHRLVYNIERGSFAERSAVAPDVQFTLRIIERFRVKDRRINNFRAKIERFFGSPPLMGIGTRQHEALIRKAGKQEGNGMLLSCLPYRFLTSLIERAE